MTMHEVYLSLGSNLDPERNLVRAIELLRERCTILAVSSAYRTAPQGDPDQPDFLNLALKLTTSQLPLAFKKAVVDSIEQQLKRVRDPDNKNAPRTIDLDIALWNTDVFDYGHKPWHIPDPDILRFAHVTVPLAEIAPDYIHPETGETLAQIAARFDRTGIRRVRLA